MEILNENQEYAISKFLQRYDYDAVLDILEEAGIMYGDLYFLMESNTSKAAVMSYNNPSDLLPAHMGKMLDVAFFLFEGNTCFI
jgi:hypothetical protein